MSNPSTLVRYRPLRAPQEDQTALVEPAFADVGVLVAENERLLARHNYDVQGRSLAGLRRQARTELLAEARRWTATYRDVDGPTEGLPGRVFLAGHQPQIFHPGVWLKNFALGELAAQHDAVAVNLLIDSDTVKTTALPVPGGSVTEPHVSAIPYDRPGDEVPYEERTIRDRGTFASFARRVQAEIAPLVPHPMVDDYWPLAVERSRAIDKVGACLAQSRHQLEGRWGLKTLEVPQSRVCATESFAWLVAHVLAELPRFREAYNESVGEYRRVHRIRSTAHPLPDLAAIDGWIEAPLWIWTADDPRRRRLFAQRRGETVVVTDRRALEIELPLPPGGDAGRAVERLIELAGDGVKIRSRALLTTLWARLFLGELFIHGIGGAKYDQVTDALIASFFGLTPPAFMVLSGTLKLPIERGEVDVGQLREVDRQLRRLTYHPEQFLNGVELSVSEATDTAGETDAAELVATKRRWVDTPQTRSNARKRCRTIRRVNELLQPRVQPQRERLLQERARIDGALQAERVLGARDYGFCLYAEKTFRQFLAALLHKPV